MSKRPDYVHCVRYDKNKSWCNRNTAIEWVFQDATHAVSSAKDDSWHLICPECADELIRIIKKATYTSVFNNVVCRET